MLLTLRIAGLLLFDLSPGTVVEADLTPLNGTAPTAVRYAWGVLDCCNHADPDLFVKCVVFSCVVLCRVGAVRRLLVLQDVRAGWSVF